MKAHITLNKKEFIRDIPTYWEDPLLTFGDFLKLEACGTDIVKVIALLTRLDYEQLKVAKITNLEEVIAKLGFLNKPHPLLHADFSKMSADQLKHFHQVVKDHLPREVYGYPVPKNLEMEQVQMYTDLNTFVSESKNLTPLEQLERYTLYVAAYATVKFKGEHDWQHAEQLAPVFLNAPCVEVMAVGNFTLMKLIGLNLHINLNSLKAGSRIKRFRLAFKGWVLLTVHSFQYLISKKGLVIKKMKS
jgi:hypothetical protein